MNDQYPIGTICIGQNFIKHPQLNNAQGVIVAPLADHVGDGLLEYIVDWSTGDVNTLCLPRNLKFPPPKHKEWADEAIRKLKKQSSDHVVIQLADAIPEEAA